MAACISVSVALLPLVGCGVPGLTAKSTCAEFNDAPVELQSAVIQELVVESEGGRPNPLREANAAAGLDNATIAGITGYPVEAVAAILVAAAPF